MSAWGISNANNINNASNNNNKNSCQSLLDKVEQNDSQLQELFVLPMKTFGGPEVNRLSDTLKRGKNTYLTRISASGHAVPNESLYNLGMALATMMPKDDDTAMNAATATTTTNSVTSLAIGDSSMGHTGILAFTKGIMEGGGQTMLEEIDFSYKGFGYSGLELILSCFTKRSCPNLRYLNVRRNENIGNETTTTTWRVNDDNNSTIMRLSFASVSHVEELDLSHCQLTGDFLIQFFGCLKSTEEPSSSSSSSTVSSSSSSSSLNIKKLHLQDNPFQGKGFRALYPLLFASPLIELNISNCEIGDTALELLAANSTLLSTTTTTSLQKLDLSNNGITAAGAVAYLTRVTIDPLLSIPLLNLVELNLAGNPLGKEGVTILATALHEYPNGTLKKLDLTNTNCGIQGAKDIITRTKLESLHLFNNALGSDGFIALAPTLRGGHASLEQLDLGGNGANQASVVALLSALLETNPDDEEKQMITKNALKVIVVGANESGDAVEQIVKQIKEVHPTLDIARDKKAQRPSQE